MNFLIAVVGLRVNDSFVTNDVLPINAYIGFAIGKQG